ncbi:MAG TPA: SsrA-binding protein SmpB [Candidatus Limadaptatus stercoripullorum]|uniref:SsrA-binding protein n=1 Tax=Candidatus Limadaptatus stercoripullorum TaxID=2840846 RepID=A0A9D1N962_9FIRM|nr:SsrA-binding protein SmpB [Candidatus Limadaptatus stercoripullorum]
MKVIASNKKAFHDYFVEETLEAGIVLVGTEVKSVRLGAVNLRDSYAVIKGGEVFLVGAHIAPYEKGSYFNVDPRRTRKLLLAKAEIRKLAARTERKGYTLVPLKIYLKGSLVKVELGLCRGKEQRDKRETIKRRDAEREMARAIKEHNARG